MGEQVNIENPSNLQKSQIYFTLSLVCANLRSIIAKEKHNERAFLASKATIFAFSETWWTNMFDAHNMLSLPGFHLNRKKRPNERKTKLAGVMIAVSNSIRQPPFDIIDENNIVAWTKHNANEPYHLISFYNPP